MYQPEAENEFGQDEFAEEYEFGDGEWAGEEEVFNEDELLELTAELMNVASEQELDYFIKNLVKRAAGAIGKAVRSPVGQAVTGVLRSAAKKALPLAGGALGAWVGGPLGAKLGSGLASAAGNALGLEAELLSPEDREFEGGKQFVRLAGATVRNTLNSPAGADPRAAAQSAIAQATKALAPGLLAGRPAASAPPAPSGVAGGRWIRRGRHILILNA